MPRKKPTISDLRVQARFHPPVPPGELAAMKLSPVEFPKEFPCCQAHNEFKMPASPIINDVKRCCIVKRPYVPKSIHLLSTSSHIFLPHLVQESEARHVSEWIRELEDYSKHSLITGDVNQWKLLLSQLRKLPKAKRPHAYVKLMAFEKTLRKKLGIDILFPTSNPRDISLLQVGNGKGEQLAHSDFHVGDGLVVCLFPLPTKESTRFFDMPHDLREKLVRYFYEHPPPNRAADYTSYIATAMETVMPRTKYGPGTIPRFESCFVR